MKVPCPLLPQAPWSPVGYRVVEVADETVPKAPARPPERRAAAEPPREFGWPPCYELAPVVEEVVTPRRSDPPIRRRPPRTKGSAAPVWIAATIGGLAIVTIFCLISVEWSRIEEEREGPRVVMADVADAEVDIPRAAEVVAEKVVAEKAPAAPARELLPLPADLAEGRPQAAACRVPPAGRETFGTAVEFLRNPQEANRAAAQQRKLSFVLHVSGNFEEARFT